MPTIVTEHRWNASKHRYISDLLRRRRYLFSAFSVILLMQEDICWWRYLQSPDLFIIMNVYLCSSEKIVLVHPVVILINEWSDNYFPGSLIGKVCDMNPVHDLVMIYFPIYFFFRIFIQLKKNLFGIEWKFIWNKLKLSFVR